MKIESQVASVAPDPGPPSEASPPLLPGLLSGADPVSVVSGVASAPVGDPAASASSVLSPAAPPESLLPAVLPAPPLLPAASPLSLATPPSPLPSGVASGWGTENLVAESGRSGLASDSGGVASGWGTENLVAASGRPELESDLVGVGVGTAPLSAAPESEGTAVSDGEPSLEVEGNSVTEADALAESVTSAALLVDVPSMAPPVDVASVADAVRLTSLGRDVDDASVLVAIAVSVLAGSPPAPGSGLPSSVIVN